MAGGMKRRPSTSEKPQLLSLRVDPKIAEAFQDHAYKLKMHQNALFEEMWRVYAENRNVAS